MRWLILSILLITFALPVAAQNTTKYSTQLFDTKVEKLPPNFAGHDAMTLFAQLEMLEAESYKGEYETTAEYQARLKELRERRLKGELKANDLFAFELSVICHYDAD